MSIDERKIIILPEFEKIKNEVEKLRAEVSMLVLERDELKFVECKNIEMVYMLKLGNLEYKAYELNIAVMRFKRKIDLIQAKKNRQEKLNLFEIESTLDKEFVQYRKELNEHISKINKAIERSKGKLLSETETKKIKKLYRTIVKVLHPDLNSNLSGEQIKLFQNAVIAYKNADLETLKIISSMINTQSLNYENKDSLRLLVKEKERLKMVVKILNEDIIKIKNTYPYTLKTIINDKNKIADKKKEINNVIKQFTHILEVYKSKIEEMVE